MDSKIKLSIKSKLKNILKSRDILDVILFGSSIKGKTFPKDIDIAVITNKPVLEDIKGFHISTLKSQDFFLNPPTLVNTLLREGYSLKYEKFFAERYQFSSKVLFTYKIASLKPSQKVKVVTILRGKKKEAGIVEEYHGKWLAKQVFTVPLASAYLFEQFFLNFSIPFKKYFILIY